MVFPVKYWSRCNEKLSSIIKSTRLSLLLTTLIFLSVSSAPTEEPRRCHWCGPLAEQVHRSRRARPCAAPFAETVCEAPHHYCATVALAPPYTESRLCVKTYQDECYPLYCNTTQTYKMTCPCRGDFCNGPNTPREETAFKQLRQLAASGRTKRSAEASTHLPMNGKYDSTSEPPLALEFSNYHLGKAAAKRDTDYKSGEMSISSLNRSVKGDDSEINGVNERKTHDAIVNDSDNSIETDKDKYSTGSAETKRCETPTTASADTTSKTEHDTDVEEKVTITTVQPVLTTQPSKDEYSQSITNQHTTTEDHKSNDSNDILKHETSQSTTAEISPTKSIETSFIAISNESYGGDRSQSSNEIPNEDGVTSASTELTKQFVSTPKLNEITFDDIVKNYQPNVEVPVDDVNLVHVSVTSNKPQELALDYINRAAKTNMETTENNERETLTTAEPPSCGPKENNKVERHDPSEASPISHDTEEKREELRHYASEAPTNKISHSTEPNGIAINKLSAQDTNTTSVHSIQILDLKIEGTNGEEGTNSNETCNQTGTCNSTMPTIAHVETTKQPETATESNLKPMATQFEIKEDVINKPTMTTETILGSNGTTQKPAITTAANINKPAEAVTTLPIKVDKVEPTTELASTSSIKMSKQTKEKNNAFTASGSFLLLANAFLVVVGL